MARPLPKPEWLRRNIQPPGKREKVLDLIGENSLFTVCREANCPNRAECHARGEATFLLLGPTCTRRCTFCAVDKTKVKPRDPEEPKALAKAVSQMNLDFCVLTMVTRDDLPDGGAAHVAESIRLVRGACPGIKVEVLISDLGGDENSLATVLDVRPEVLNHNVETVPRLYSKVRPQADYSRSLELLARASASQSGCVTKSGLMLGLGEEREEVEQVMADLFEAGCRLVTLGQYLAPSRKHFPVARYVTPEEFDSYAELAGKMGFAGVASAPLVRSSYKAGELYQAALRARRAAG